MIAPGTISSFFCLKSNRSNFDLDPSADSDFLFGEKQWADDIDKRIQRSIVMGRPLRQVWWGQYGIGKTHRLRYTKKLIEKNNYAYFPCFALASDLEEKSGFERLHSQLLSSIGFERMRVFAEDYLLRLHNGENIAKIADVADTATDVAVAVQNLGSKNPNLAAAAWAYLSGQELERNVMLLAGVSKPQINTANEFAAVHQIFAHIVEHQTGGKKLLYLIDEVENLTKIKNKNTASRWQELIRALLDVKTLSLVFTVGAENMQGIPSIIIMPDIVRRIQIDNYEQMAAYKTATAEKFVRELLENFIDPVCRSTLEAENGWVNGSNDYESALYPFSKGAFGIFCNHATVDPKNAKPSEILNALNNAAYEAMVAGSKLITAQVLSTMNMS